jgi:hypothetical protein
MLALPSVRKGALFNYYPTIQKLLTKHMVHQKSKDILETFTLQKQIKK